MDRFTNQIHIRRTWIDGNIGDYKTKASRAAVPMCDLLAQYLKAWQRETTYGRPGDWVFASAKTKGRTTLVGNMAATDYLRPSAIKAGVVLEAGQRFGWHNLSHSLASFLVAEKKVDVRTVQDMLRHSNSSTTIGIYSQSSPESRVQVQESVLDSILKQQKVM